MSFFTPPRDFPVSLSGLQEDLNRIMERVWHAGVSTGPFDGQAWAPPVDMYETDDGYTVLVEVAGVEPAGVDVSYVGQVLTVRGDKPRPVGEGEDRRSIRSERRYGKFQRTLDLPADSDPDRLSAECRAGVLTITIPRSEASKPKTVKVAVKGD
ncbi:MAG: Hsp20/alpha crystallin family protein [Phycisphaerae bacterium]